MTDTNMSTETGSAIIFTANGNAGLSSDALVYSTIIEQNMQPQTPEIQDAEVTPLVDLDPLLNAQFKAFCDLYEGKLPPEQLARFRLFTERYLASRYMRGNELDAPELIEARRLKEAFHGEKNHFFLVTCIDGRNIPTVMFTFVPHSGGGFIRTQAGDLASFEEQQNSDEVILDKNSDYYKRLLHILKEYKGGTIYYGLDSHVGCAARDGMSASDGGTSDDAGLYEDIMRKKKIAAELECVVNDLKAQGEDMATLIPDLFSYDPKKGTMMMGLKKYTDQVDPASGFTPEVRTQLADEGKIVDTWHLLNDAEVVAELEAHVTHKANFRTNYAESVQKNWQSITDLYDDGHGKVFTILMDKLHKIYDEDGKPEEELAHKAKLLLKNLVTRWSIARNDSKWEFDTHQERLIAISERAYGPFAGKVDHFLVSSVEGKDDILENIATANDLIRGFRKTKAITDLPTDALLIDNQALIKDLALEGVSDDEIEATWTQLQDISLEAFSQFDWDDARTNNLKRTDIDEMIYGIIERKEEEARLTGTTFSLEYRAGHQFVDAVWEVFARMRSLIRKPTIAHQLKEGRTIVMNTIHDGNGRPRIIVPLIPHLAPNAVQ